MTDNARLIEEALPTFTNRGMCECGWQSNRDPQAIREHTVQVHLWPVIANALEQAEAENERLRSRPECDCLRCLDRMEASNGNS